MNVSLPPELEALVQDKIQSGQYVCRSEVICEALRLLRDRDMIQSMRLEELRREIKIGLDELDRGVSTYYDHQSLGAMFDEIKREGREQLTERQKKETL